MVESLQRGVSRENILSGYLNAAPQNESQISSTSRAVEQEEPEENADKELEQYFRTEEEVRYPYFFFSLLTGPCFSFSPADPSSDKTQGSDEQR